MGIEPSVSGAEPRYDQRHVGVESEGKGFEYVAGPDGPDSVLSLRQDARLFIACLAPGESATRELAVGRRGFRHVARGDLTHGDLA